jgi:RND superfamily putative drug exporter
LRQLIVEGLARFVLRHRWLVLATWLVVFLVAGFASSKLSDLLTNRFTLPGTDSERVELILQDHFGQRSTGSFTMVVEKQGNARELVPQVRVAARKAASALPTGRLVAVTPVSEDVVSAQIVSDLEPADSKGHTDAMRAAVGSIAGAHVYITGQAAIEHDLDPVFNEDLKKGELYIAVPIALLILVFTFGTLSFLLPFVFTLVTIPTTLGIIWIFANFMELTTISQIWSRSSGSASRSTTPSSSSTASERSFVAALLATTRS